MQTTALKIRRYVKPDAILSSDNRS